MWISYPITHISILRRRHPRNFFESTCKVILIRKAAGFCYFGNGLIRKIQQLLCPVNANLQYKLHWRHTCNLLKESAEMHFAHFAKIGAFRYGDIKIWNHFYVTDHFTDFILAFFSCMRVSLVKFIAQKCENGLHHSGADQLSIGNFQVIVLAYSGD